jgi:hypothetical protein
MTLGLSEPYNVWSEGELDLLKKLYSSRTAQEIAEQIGKPVQATKKKIAELGIRKKYRYDELYRVVSGVREKLCHKCKIWKNETEFYKNSAKKDGLTGQCKKCLYEGHRRQK